MTKSAISKPENFQTDFQIGRSIEIEVNSEAFSLHMGTESETVNLQDLTSVLVDGDFIHFEKNGLFKAYIPKRACTDEQWNELVTTFSERSLTFIRDDSNADDSKREITAKSGGRGN